MKVKKPAETPLSRTFSLCYIILCSGFFVFFPFHSRLINVNRIFQVAEICFAWRRDHFFPGQKNITHAWNEGWNLMYGNAAPHLGFFSQVAYRKNYAYGYHGYRNISLFKSNCSFNRSIGVTRSQSRAVWRENVWVFFFSTAAAASTA